MSFWNSIFGKEKEDGDGLFPPLAKCSKVVDEGGEPQVKLHLPQGKDLPVEQQDLLLAMSIVGSELSDMEGFEPMRFGFGDFKSPQLIAKVKGIEVSVIVKVARFPNMPSIKAMETAMAAVCKNLYCANFSLMPCGQQEGVEAFFVNYRGLEKVPPPKTE